MNRNCRLAPSLESPRDSRISKRDCLFEIRIKTDRCPEFQARRPAHGRTAGASHAANPPATDRRAHGGARAWVPWSRDSAFGAWISWQDNPFGRKISPATLGADADHGNSRRAP